MTSFRSSPSTPMPFNIGCNCSFSWSYVHLPGCPVVLQGRLRFSIIAGSITRKENSFMGPPRIRKTFSDLVHIPWADTALSTARDIKSSNSDKIMIKCLQNYPTMKEQSAFLSYSNSKELMSSTIDKTVLHVTSSR